jgi:methylated-DNA-[protein]-cysteine S-methyltransferase
MTLVARRFDSPLGSITLAGEDGLLHHLRMDDQTHAPVGQDGWVPGPDAFGDAVEQLQAYFAGELTTFDVALRLDGTPFQQQVWAALQEIPYGETWSYGELAEHIGRPGASRAVGLANGRNPIGVIVPCHRVIGADGSLTGYGGGLDRKRLLLDLEQARVAPRAGARR